MQPKTISEKLMFSTVRLETLNGSSGSGFFYNFKIKDKIYSTIITNKHVVNDNPKEVMQFLLHLGKNGKVIKDNFMVTLETEWIFHPDPEVDLCFCYFNPLVEKIKNDYQKDVFFIPIDQDLILNKSQLKNLSALEPVVMVGYPNGLWDRENNYPLFRTGVTASHPAVNFNKPSEGVVDMACFPGSSGSPIFILNENGYNDKNGNFYFGTDRLIFLGILYAGPTMTLQGEIVTETIPTIQQNFSRSQMMINLGYYIKSYEIDKLRNIIKGMVIN